MKKGVFQQKILYTERESEGPWWFGKEQNLLPLPVIESRCLEYPAPSLVTVLTTFRLALGAFQPLIRGAKGIMSPAIKRKIREAENSLLSLADFKYEGSYTCNS